MNKKEYSIKGYYALNDSHILKYIDFRICLFSNTTGYPVIIIDTEDYEVIKEIRMDNLICQSSSLCMVNETSFGCLCDNVFLQFSLLDFNLILQKITFLK